METLLMELDGDALDMAVARAEIANGQRDVRISDAGRPTIQTASGAWEPFRPSLNWHHAGPLIERERIGLQWQPNQMWLAIMWGRGGAYGPSPLIAAMRAYVTGC